MTVTNWRREKYACEECPPRIPVLPDEENYLTRRYRLDKETEGAADAGGGGENNGLTESVHCFALCFP